MGHILPDISCFLCSCAMYFRASARVRGCFFFLYPTLIWHYCVIRKQYLFQNRNSVIMHFRHANIHNNLLYNFVDHLQVFSRFHAVMRTVAVSGIVLACVVVLDIARRYLKNTRPYPLPPGPRGLPFIGNVIGPDPDAPWLTYAEWAKQYGSCNAGLGCVICSTR